MGICVKEFDFIDRYLKQEIYGAETILGVGDDAAIVRVPIGFDLHISADMLVEEHHFFGDDPPETLGARILAVNLSDMAAMGATPRWALLCAALPDLDEAWLAPFCHSFFALAKQHQVTLIGGDTTKSEVRTFNVTLMGLAPKDLALKRSNAKVGDDIWVSGRLGLAAFALACIWQNEQEVPAAVFLACEQVRTAPVARVALGEKLLTIAHAAQDVSDGLVQDLLHILKASNVAATLWADCVPTHEFIATLPNKYQYSLAGGDDYELIFTAPKSQRDAIEKLSQAQALPLSLIGVINMGSGLDIIDAAGQPVSLPSFGFDHFA